MNDEELVAEALARLHEAGSKGGEGEDVDTNGVQEEEGTASPKKRGRKPKRPEPKFPVEPQVIQIVKKPRTYMNHSYRDFSKVPPEIGYEHPTNIEGMSFSQKVHDILSDPSYASYIGWCDHGRAFKVLVPVRLEQSRCLMKYFGNDRYSSFLRQLSNYGFKHITQGRDRNAYYHEFMLRGLPHLTQFMPEPKDARRLIPDPDNEPDFYEISRRFPLETQPPSSGGAGAAAPVATMGDRRRVAETVAVQRDSKRPALTTALNPHVPVRGSGHSFPSESYAHPSAIPPSSGLAAFPGGASAALQAHLLALQQQRHQQALQIHRQQQLHQQLPHGPVGTSNNPDAAVSALQAYLLAARSRNNSNTSGHPSNGPPAPPRGPPHFGGRGPTY